MLLLGGALLAVAWILQQIIDIAPATALPRSFACAGCVSVFW